MNYECDNCAEPICEFEQDYCSETCRVEAECRTNNGVFLNEHGTVVDPALKPSNPKDIIGSNKIPLHLWPETATVLGSLALLDGALKYGRSNFRAVGVKATIYTDAAKRHLNNFLECRDTDADSGLPELAHALACIAIIVDAQAAGRLNDDRLYRGGYLELVKKMTPHVARLKALHADKSPKHYTCADNEPYNGELPEQSGAI